MNVFQAMLARSQSTAIDSDHLPELNAFVDVATGGKTELVPVESIGRTSFAVRRPTRASVGVKALFNYSNGRGRFRFYAGCTALDGRLATYALPVEITVIETFGNKRRGFRLKKALPVLWRYAPDGAGFGDYQASTTVDISSVGVSLVVPRELQAGTQIEMKFDLGEAVEPFVAIGTLTRATQKQLSGKFVAGLGFVNLNERHANAIGDYITARQTGQRKRGLAEN